MFIFFLDFSPKKLIKKRKFSDQAFSVLFWKDHFGGGGCLKKLNALKIEKKKYLNFVSVFKKLAYSQNTIPRSTGII